jgi:hypothetical protein
VSLEKVMNSFILTKITMNTPNTAMREINPDSTTKVRPMLSPRVKQTIEVPLVFRNKACSSTVHFPVSIDMGGVIVRLGSAAFVRG